MSLAPPIEPMLARPLGHTLPVDPRVAFEPKWDGFRCLAFLDDPVVLQGRGRSRTDGVVDLAYAFPEVVAALAAQVPRGTVLDGELVIEHEGRLDFGVLSTRLRPRSEAGGANIARLAASTPATLVAFDVLQDRGANLMAEPFSRRRAVLEQIAADWTWPLLLTPSTSDRVAAQHWFDQLESAGVDGVIVKPMDDAYRPGVRAQGKVKHRRTADVVLAGWRAHARAGADGSPVVGSLLLGLFDGDRLHYVGAASAFSAQTRARLVAQLAPLTVPADGAHPWRDVDPAVVAVPGEANRWKKEQPWVALRPERVLEVAYDQFAGRRLRHVAAFERWRPDRDPSSCRFDQLDVPPPARIAELLPTLPST